MTFKVGMFDIKNIQKHSNEFIEYKGHLPYYIIAVMGIENVKKRNEYLKGIGESTYNTEVELLKSERRNNNQKIESLQQFLEDNPQFQDIVQKQHLKPLFE